MDTQSSSALTATGAILRQNVAKTVRGDVQFTRATRRMLKLAYRQKRLLDEINRILRRQLQRAENTRVRQSVRKQRAGNRLKSRSPHLRVRSRDNFGRQNMPKFVYATKIRPGTPVYYPTQGWADMLGDTGHMVDYTPVARLHPPRNPMTAGRSRKNSTSASACLENQGTYAYIRIPKCKFASYGLRAYNMLLDTKSDITLEDRKAGEILAQLYKEVYSADIQLNEYLVEWKQVFRLMKDPYKTVLGFSRTLKRWTNRDAWIWIPERSYRRMNDGSLLVSEVPTGGILMSMRTRRTLGLHEVSNTVFQAACNRWLQYRYGIAPLAKDITAVMGDWVTPKLKLPMKSVSARTNVSRVVLERDYSYTVSPVVFNYRVKYESGEFYSGKQWYSLKKEPPMSYRLGVHPSQWINAIWNGLPYSFVADWVVNVSDWLTATTEVPWIQPIGNYVTRKKYECITAHLTGIHTTSSTEDRLTVSNKPVATFSNEVVCRKVDLPYTGKIYASKAWHSVKNAITYLTLLPGITSSQRNYRG